MMITEPLETFTMTTHPEIISPGVIRCGFKTPNMADFQTFEMRPTSNGKGLELKSDKLQGVITYMYGKCLMMDSINEGSTESCVFTERDMNKIQTILLQSYLGE